MLERNELARAMTDLPDDLLLEAEQVLRPGKTIRFRRLIAAAAVIALLAVTVCAAAVGITWTVEQEPGEAVVEKYGNIALDYYKDYDGTQSFEKLEYAVPLGVVELPEQNMTQLREVLRRYWEMTRQGDYDLEMAPEQEFVYDSSEVDSYLENLIGRYSTTPHSWSSFGTVEDVERLLGIPLDVSPKFRDAVRAASEDGFGHVVTIRIFTGTTVAQADERKGNVEPTKILVSLYPGGYATNGSANGTIVIPLTQETAQAGIQGLHYSYEKEGAIWQEEQTVGGRDVMFFGNDPEMGYDGWSEAVYVHDGIGYTVSARRDTDIPYYSPNWPYYDSAKEMVLSLLNNLS